MNILLLVSVTAYKFAAIEATGAHLNEAATVLIDNEAVIMDIIVNPVDIKRLDLSKYQHLILYIGNYDDEMDKDDLALLTAIQQNATENTLGKLEVTIL